MKIKNLVKEDDAVSPVIGVILMVAITVILAAVIGTFVLGLGDQVGDSAPQASFSFEKTTYDPGGAGPNDFVAVKITHDGGDAIDEENLNVLVDGSTAYTAGSSDTTEGLFSSEVTAGSSITIVAATDTSPAIGADTYVDDGGSLDIDDASATGDLVSGVGLSSDQTVRVVWSSSSGGDTATIGKFTIP